MLGLVFLFLLIAIVAGILGFTSIMVASIGIAQVVFVIFLILLVLTLLMNLLRSMDSTIDPKLKGNIDVLGWSVAFLIIALVAGLFGFTGLMVAAGGIAKIIFIVFLILFFISLIIHLVKRK